MGNKNRKFVAVSASSALMASALAPAAVSADTNGDTFTDLDESNPYYDQIMALVEAQVLNGYEADDTFRPERSLTRAEASVAVASLLDVDTTKEFDNPYSDVDYTDWYADSVLALTDAGVVQGSNGHFNADYELTRAELAVMVHMAFKEQLEYDSSEDLPFTDVPEGIWYEDSLKALYQNGLIAGVGNNMYAPDADFERQHFAALLARADFNFGGKLKKPEGYVIVEKVEVVGESTIKVSYSDGEIVEYELDTPLEEGVNDIRVDYNGKEFAFTVDYELEVMAEGAVEAFENSLLESDYEDAQELVNMLPEGSDLRSNLQDRLDTVWSEVNNIVTDVQDATTASELYEALNQAPFVEVKEANAELYFEAMVEANVDSTDGIQEVIDSVNEAQKDFADNVQPVLDAATDQELLDALENYENVMEENLDQYDFSGDIETSADIQAEIDETNAEVALEEFTVDVDTTQEEIDELTWFVEQVTGVDENGDIIEDNLNEAQQTVLDSYNMIIDDYAKQIVSEVNNANTVEELYAALEGLNVEAYNNLTVDQQLDVSQRFMVTNDGTEFSTTGEVKDAVMYEINGDANYPSYQSLLDDVNNATTVDEADVALEALGIEEYDNLDSTGQLNAAENVINNRDNDGYQSFTEIINNF
ncbi:hypothetical protein E3U55_14265 [Filobacillus milosensis]|uniref:SLH domain-containing protein n=1 Tax=Filobacillus milosensis TaxID=94137 RepID=A0A4Y8IE61_9BACI|nr:S-layer homology domain-containing protein [Filobacillus milosensis]TFB14210.1 hypothetical protein E3U55_14265 [Filobacillus milosensis]